MYIDIYKARTCRYFIEGYCMLSGEKCVAEAYANNESLNEDCDKYDEGDK